MKLIHAQHTANIANANPARPAADVVLGEQVGELRGRDAEGDDEGQVEQQLQRAWPPGRPRAGRAPSCVADGVPT